MSDEQDRGGADADVIQLPRRCAGRTRTGKPCRAKPQPGRDFCASHDEDDLGLGEDVAEGGRAPSIATILVSMAMERYTFGVGSTGETYGLPLDGPKVALLLRGGRKSLRAQLARLYFTRTGSAAPSSALADAMLVIEGLAEEAEEAELHLRVARHGGGLWLDLGDDTGRAVRIQPGRWTVEDEPPVLFKRTALNAQLPEPVRGGRLADLWRWLNFVEEDRPLVAAWLVSVLFGAIPHPVLTLTGEQGTGKSTAAKVLVKLLDPSPVPLRKPPKDPDSWVTAAAGSWVVGVDNLSEIQPWLSDSLCRAVTGDGDVRRKLYTDGDFAIFSFRRCLILNGIDLGSMRGDLAERNLPVELHRIPDDERRTEEEIWPAWDSAHPHLLGAVLALAAGVLRLLPSVELKSKPRMADFAKVLSAIDELLGTNGLERYLSKQGSLATESLQDDVFLMRVQTIVSGTFTGSAADLLEKVTPAIEGWKPPQGWPGTARKVTTLLRRQSPVMRKAGWAITDDAGANHTNTIQWTITPPSRKRSDGNQGSQGSQGSQDASDASLASDESGQLALAETLCALCHEVIDPAGGTIHPSCESQGDTAA